MDFMIYIIHKVYILIPALYIIGLYLKKTPESTIPDWWIPWILLICGIVGSIIILGFTGEAVIQGILVSGVTVFGNQLIKQTIKRD